MDRKQMVGSVLHNGIVRRGPDAILGEEFLEFILPDFLLPRFTTSDGHEEKQDDCHGSQLSSPLLASNPTDPDWTPPDSLFAD
jgi:hypothetical protein